MTIKTKSVESPIAEITLRKYEKPADNSDRRELIKKLCLSIGLLQPGDSRDVIIDIMHTIIDAQNSLASRDIMKRVTKQRQAYDMPLIGLTYPNICRQLRRLKTMMIIESKADRYRLAENDTLKNIFNEKIMRYYLSSITERINEYLEKIETTKHID
jgi:hypothetical protein